MDSVNCAFVWPVYFFVVSFPRGWWRGGVWQHCEWWSPLPTLPLHWGYWHHEEGKAKTHTHTHTFARSCTQTVCDKCCTYTWNTESVRHPHLLTVRQLMLHCYSHSSFRILVCLCAAVKEEPREKVGIWWEGCRGGEEAAIFQSK